MTSRGRTSLHSAAAHGTVTQLQELLQQADVQKLINTGDAAGCTPLMLAAKTLMLESCLVLLHCAGIDVTLVDSKGLTVLHYVCERPTQGGDLAALTEMVELLYEKGATSKADKRGYLPLHMACESGNYTAASLILEHEPDVVNAKTVRAARRAVLPAACTARSVLSRAQIFARCSALKSRAASCARCRTSAGVRCTLRPKSTAAKSPRCSCDAAATCSGDARQRNATFSAFEYLALHCIHTHVC